MKGNVKLMPEALYPIDNTMSLEKLARSINTGKTIVGKVVSWDSTKNGFNLNLGNNFFGFLPVEDSTIYPKFQTDGTLTKYLKHLLEKRVVVRVKSIDQSGSTIILSRKDCMSEAFDIISNSIGEYTECYVTKISKYGVFVDISNGIYGLISHKNMCLQKIDNYSKIGFKKGSVLKVKILSIDENFHVNLSYRDQFENLSSSLNPNELIEVTILEPVNRSGFFAYINPSTPAIVDVPEYINCSYGDKIIAQVKGTQKTNPNNLKLDFVLFA